MENRNPAANTELVELSKASARSWDSAPGVTEKKPADDDEQCSYWQLYSMADSYDYLLLGLGLVGAAAGGVLMPLFSVVFGDFVNAFGDPSQLDFMEVGFILAQP
ncbi:ABC transmembrane type-1 domain-containing protein [Haematococcus lacustris]|uniref:ABC transmembrane type-1 domain-containing protein n=1 Tax=Haematococcus lacustris TaxID=44745 RepID=A0A699ZGQ2_HAELA|nr:ABC transmembrane type-1 domain-containing protein [Haematococcus lacustris]